MEDTKIENIPLDAPTIVASSLDKNPKRPVWSFRLKLTLLAVFIACIPVGIVGWSIQSVNENALSHANEELLFAVIEDAARVATVPIEQAEKQLTATAGALANDALELEQRLAVARAVVSGGSDRAIGIYDASRMRLDAVGALDIERLPKTLGDDQGPHSDVVMDANGAYVLIRKSLTIGSEAWTLVTTASVGDLQERMETAGVARLGQAHRLLAVDTRGMIIADSDPERVGSKATLKDIGALKALDFDALDEGFLAFGEFETSDGIKQISALKSVEGLPWAVVAEIPRDVAYASLAQMRRVILWVVLAAMLISALIALIFARQLTRPIRTLVSFANQLAARKFDSRVEIHTRDELSLLGTALSDAAIELQASDTRIRKEVAIRSDLGRYLPEQLVNRIVDRSQNMALGGERRRITVLFADVVGFTPLAESQDAQHVVAILNELFTVLTEVVFRHKGTVDKFVGDCIMAFWGAPNDQPDHTELALLAAEDMMQWLEVANEGWEERYGIRINLAIGVNTGEAVVGNFGSETRMEYTAIGDVVNVASRLEAIARPNQILMSRTTRDSAVIYLMCAELVNGGCPAEPKRSKYLRSHHEREFR